VMDPVPDPVAPERSFSLANFTEVLFPLLDVVAPTSVIEVGAFRGDFTRELLSWAGAAGARVTAIEPEPAPELLALGERQPELELVREPSHEALGRLPRADVVVIDGDHNYYTVREELRLISDRSRSSQAPLPLLVFHDVCWPHARRDTYYAPERIPEQHRQPLAQDVLIAPGEPGAATAGLLYPWAAEREGGPRNGVLTAIEDFIEQRRDLRLAVIPAFFGLGILWPEGAPWAGRAAEIVGPWDRNPILERLEADRLAHIVDRFRLDRSQELLRSLLGSRAFALAERLSSLRQAGGGPVFSRERVRQTLGEEEPGARGNRGE
jgi:Methyltransferase domain